MTVFTIEQFFIHDGIPIPGVGETARACAKRARARTHTHTHTHTHAGKNTATTHTSSGCGLRQAVVPPLPGQGSPAEALSSSWHSASGIQRQWLGRTVAMAAGDQTCRQGQWLGFGRALWVFKGVASCRSTGSPAAQTSSWHEQLWPHPEPTSLLALGTGRLS